MKKEADIMMERGEWIDKVSNEIQKRTFEMLEKKSNRINGNIGKINLFQYNKIL